MITKVFAVYDSKAEAFLQPFFSDAIGSALRAFEDAVNDSNGPISRHPGDYQIYEIGSFDQRSAELLALTPCKLLGNGLDFKLARKAAREVGMPQSTVPEAMAEVVSNNGK